MSSLIKLDDVNVVWKSLPGSQTLASSCPAQVILYHGTRGPGKTDTQLMRYRRRVGLGYGRHWRGVIFDREYKNLDDMVSKSLRWFPDFFDGCKFSNSKSDYKWRWPTGEELLFRTVKEEADYWGFHGQEFPFIGWNELTKYPDSKLFNAMMSCNRSSFRPEDFPYFINRAIYEATGHQVTVPKTSKWAMKMMLPEIPLEVFATANPFGVGHNWIKKEFIDRSPPGKILRTSVNVFNPRSKVREDVVKTQCHIFGSYKENPYLSPEYVASLETIDDPNKKAAWLGGSWDVTCGGMFDDLWHKTYHVVKPFNIPFSWRLSRSFDYGSSKPFSVGWWAVSDGTDYTDANGNVVNTVRGDIFRFMEWYGSTGRQNEGLRMLTEKISEGIVEREIKKGILGKVNPGPADNSIFDTLDGNCFADKMAKPVTVNGKKYKGVTWIKSNKTPGSRKQGWELLRAYLAGSLPTFLDKEKQERVPRSSPGLFVFDTCPDFITLFPTLPRDEDDLDDVDTDAEDHIGDETRYFALNQGSAIKLGKTKGTQ